MSNLIDNHKEWFLSGAWPLTAYLNMAPLPGHDGTLENRKPCDYLDPFWARGSGPLRADAVERFRSSRGMLEVVDEKWFYVGSRAPERRQITLIGRNSLADVDADDLVAEMRRRLELTKEFEVASEQFAPGRIGPGRACGRRLTTYSQLNWPLNHSAGERSYGLYAISQLFMLPSLSTIIRVASRGKHADEPIDFHQLTPYVDRAIPLPPSGSFVPAAAPQRQDIPDDVIVSILSHFINPTSPLGTVAREIKSVSRQWYRCWWKAALGSSSPTKLWFGNATQAYFGASLYRQVTEVPAKEFSLAALLSAITVPFDQRGAAAKKVSKKTKMLSALRKSKTSVSRRRSNSSGAFDYLVVNPLEIVSLDLSGQYAHDDLLNVVKTRFPNLVHLKWDRSRGLDDDRLADLLRYVPSLQTLSVAFAADLVTVNKTAAVAASLKLEELNVAGCPFGAPGLRALADSCHLVRRLDISGLEYANPTGKINTQGIPFMTFSASAFAAKELITFGGSDFPCLEVLMAADILGQESQIPFMIGPNAYRNLRALDLSTSYSEGMTQRLNSDVLQFYIEPISKCTALEVLHLNGYSAQSNDRIIELGKALSSLPRLRYLGMSTVDTLASSSLIFHQLLESSPRHAPLTIVQLTSKTNVCRRPIDAARHLVWPTAFCVDDMFQQVQPDANLVAGSRSYTDLVNAYARLRQQFETAQQIYHETQSAALRAAEQPASGFQMMMITSNYGSSTAAKREAKSIRTHEHWPLEVKGHHRNY